MSGRPLFNGRDLDGWRHVGEGGFAVVDGSLRSHGGMGLLWYAGETFGDCALRVAYRTARASDNSGVFVRIDGPPDDPWHAVHHGYEVQILGTGDEWHRSGVVYTMSRTDHLAELPPGEWNSLEIVLDGERITVRLNGTLTADFEPAHARERRHPHEPERGPRPTHGYIGLQNHDPSSIVDFREVVVTALRP